MKKTLSLLLAALLLLGCSLPVWAAESPFQQQTEYHGQFTDLPANAWYAQAVQTCYELGLMQGTSATTFQPEASITGPEAIVLAARLHSLYHGGDGQFAQAGELWYGEALSYAVFQGLFAGMGIQATEENYQMLLALFTEDSYEAAIYNESCPRYMLAMLLAAATPQDQLPAINQVTALPDFTGWNGSNDLEEILRLYNAGILTGQDPWGTFMPEDFLTRAEVATMLARIAQPELRQTFTLAQIPFEIVPYPQGLYPTSGASFQDGLLLVQKVVDPATYDVRYGYLNTKLELAIPPIYDYAQPFVDGRAQVHQDGVCSFIDPQGNTLFTCEGYEPSGEFIDGLCRVYQNSSTGDSWRYTYGLINTQGELVVPLRYDEIVIYSGNLIAANQYLPDTYTSQWRLLDGQGSPLNDQVYTDVDYDLYQDRLLVQTQAGYGFVDSSGKEAIPCQYAYAYGFDGGPAFVRGQDGKDGYIDTQGQPVLTEAVKRYASVYPFDDGFAQVADDKYQYGLMDAQGNEVLAPAYQDVAVTPWYLKATVETQSELEDPMAQGFEYRSLTYFFDRQGNPITPAQAATLEQNGLNQQDPQASQGYYVQALPGSLDDLIWGELRYAYFEVGTNQQVTPYIYTSTQPFTDGLAPVRYDSGSYLLRLKP